MWTVEPWVSRLELEAEGEVLVEDREAITTVLVVRADLLASQQGLVRKFVDAHRELTDWIVESGGSLTYGAGGIGRGNAYQIRA